MIHFAGLGALNALEAAWTYAVLLLEEHPLGC